MAKLTTRTKENRMARRSPTTGVLLLGGVVGALIGVGAAYLLLQAKEKRSQGMDEDVPVVSSGGLMKIGLLVFGLLRQIGDIGRGE
jgi:hypothetical protein